MPNYLGPSNRMLRNAMYCCRRVVNELGQLQPEERSKKEDRQEGVRGKLSRVCSSEPWVFI